MNIEISPRKVFKGLLYIILFLVCANVFGIVSKFFFDHGRLYGLIPAFDLDTEGNIPTLFSTLLLFTSSSILFFIALQHKKHNASFVPWIGLSLIFLFLGFDEIAAFHEKISGPLKDLLNTSGIFYYAWVLPYGSLLLIFVVSYWKFLTRLPKKIMRLFIYSGAIYVGGAFGFELLGGWEADVFGGNTLMYAISYTIEETLEMVGISLFIYTLLTYIVSQFESLTINITEDRKLS
jgi:hypothetical protein